ncbi:exodeoxyribonuclease VII large subunit [Hymenobacter busanensis]|uniref:Exodeoxyribonuclease 7 large subunit n=1 Tax=Hymenobacter busanensis TaxID=2607656 RepID=A0A7L4ZW99_9BACT|nr:exodeoxyribonuclease VII large subunit [Hymenobacter busanensis]KAA9332390.1 exodeoxyribonuclease VII large subunit [Hymenobacter busanensis]QHJ07273.1 exodeoxyribonuclease VII large subunit [Hymenobacter busanensis]
MAARSPRRTSASTPLFAPAPLPLAELLRRVRDVLHAAFDDAYWVTAEIAELTLPRFGAGHCYLTLTDPAPGPGGPEMRTQVRAAIWRNRFEVLLPHFEQQTGQTLRAGMRILARCQVRFHEQYGLSLDIIAIDATYTVGELARQRAETVAKLEAQDLLERNKRLPLSLAPQRLAVISSATAAGWQDFVRQLEEAPYAFDVALFPATMQGQEAPASILAALDMIRRQRQEFDVVIIIRGGGSRTDLLCFDDYGLAAAVGSFPLPVVTGIGHDRDEAVVDLTAHTALKTPTAVAIYLVERLARLEAAFDGYGARIHELALEQVGQYGAVLNRMGRQLVQLGQSQLAGEQSTLRQRLRRAVEVPQQALQREARQLSTQQQQLRRTAQHALDRQRQHVRHLSQTILRRLRRLHQRRREALLRHRYQLEVATVRATAHHALALAAAVTRHAALDHVALGRRGYVRTDSLQSLTSASPPGTLLLLQLPDGPLPVQVVNLAASFDSHS